MTKKLLEDWLTFSFTNARKGQSIYYKDSVFSSETWMARMYCMSCGCLWSMELKGYGCGECGEGKMRMMVCRYRPIIKRIPITKVWYQPSTWSGVRLEESGVWEYRLKESEAMTGVLF